MIEKYWPEDVYYIRDHKNNNEKQTKIMPDGTFSQCIYDKKCAERRGNHQINNTGDQIQNKISPLRYGKEKDTYIPEHIKEIQNGQSNTRAYYTYPYILTKIGIIKGKHRDIYDNQNTDNVGKLQPIEHFVS
jgi:hypothetical protein